MTAPVKIASPKRLAQLLTDLCATPSLVCEHFDFDVLRNHLSGPMQDHDTLDAKCQTCGLLLIVTTFASGHNDYSVMPDDYAIAQGYMVEQFAVCPVCHEPLPLQGDDVPAAHPCTGEFTELQLDQMREGLRERQEAR